MQSHSETNARTTIYSSDRRRAAGFVTFTLKTLALGVISSQREESTEMAKHAYRSRMAARLRLLTLCAISAAKLLLCIRRRSSSRMLLTRNFFRPLGRRCLVYMGIMSRKNILIWINMYLLVAPIANLGRTLAGIRPDPIDTHLGHGELPLEPPAYPVVNTLRFPPCLLHALVAVRLVAPVFVRDGQNGPLSIDRKSVV